MEFGHQHYLVKLRPRHAVEDQQNWEAEEIDQQGHQYDAEVGLRVAADNAFFSNRVWGGDGQGTIVIDHHWLPPVHVPLHYLGYLLRMGEYEDSINKLTVINRHLLLQMPSSTTLTATLSCSTLPSFVFARA